MPKGNSFEKCFRPQNSMELTFWWSWNSLTCWIQTIGFGIWCKITVICGFLFLYSALWIMSRHKYEFKTKKGLIFQKNRQMVRKNIGLIDFPLTKRISNSPLLWYDIPMPFVLGSLWIVFSSSYNSKSRFPYWDCRDKLFSLEAQCYYKKLQNWNLPPP